MKRLKLYSATLSLTDLNAFLREVDTAASTVDTALGRAPLEPAEEM
jgi:hypothetical protein